MSDLIVEVTPVVEIKKHPNADKLEIAVVKGWESIVPKGRYKVGDKVLYIPVDAVLPITFSDKIGVTKYLSRQRVKAAKLRGIISCGIVTNSMGYPEGKNLAEWLEIKKYEPELVTTQQGGKNYPRTWYNRIKYGILRMFGKYKSGIIEQHPLFHKYTDIQNIKNYPDVFKDGEPVVVTEKIHGTNSRVSVVKTWYGHKFLVGSHEKQRKLDNADVYGIPLRGSLGDKVKAMLVELLMSRRAKCVILYGEIYGGQDLKYGHNGYEAYRAFDLKIDGKYEDAISFQRLCVSFEIPTVPFLAWVGFSMDNIKEFAGFPSAVPFEDCLSKYDPFDKKSISEGVVVKPIVEREDRAVGRVVLKCINPEYLIRKDGTEDH